MYLETWRKSLDKRAFLGYFKCCAHDALESARVLLPLQLRRVGWTGPGLCLGEPARVQGKDPQPARGERWDRFVQDSRGKAGADVEGLEGTGRPLTCWRFACC